MYSKDRNGRPGVTTGYYALPPDHAAAIQRYVDQVRARGAATMAEIALGLNQMRVRAPSGRRWSASSVARFLLIKEAGSPATRAAGPRGDARPASDG